MRKPGDVTLASYEATVDRYVDASGVSDPTVQALLARVAERVPGGTALEVGSGPGFDALHMESLGLDVVRSDGATAFVERMRANGHEARVLDIRGDDLGGPFDAIVAIAVLLHLDRDEFTSFLARALHAVRPGGLIAFTVKEGDGDAWSHAKLDRPRHFTFWRADAVRAALDHASWSSISIEHIDGRTEPWLIVLAQRPTTP